MAEGAAPTSRPSGQEERSLTHHEAMEITKRSLADIISVSIPSQNIAHFETYMSHVIRKSAFGVSN